MVNRNEAQPAMTGDVDPEGLHVNVQELTQHCHMVQACGSRRQGTGLGPIGAAWPSFSTPYQHMHTPSHVIPTFRASSAGHAQHSRPQTAQVMIAILIAFQLQHLFST